MDPPAARLAVNDSLPLRIYLQYKNMDTKVVGAQPPVYGWGWYYGSLHTPNPPEWTVNGIPNGNNLTGQIFMDLNPPYTTTFKAPIRKPLKNPVTVIAKYKDARSNGRIFDTTFTSYIEIIEGTERTSDNSGGQNNDNGGGKDGNGKEKDNKENDPKLPDPQTADSTASEVKLFEIRMISRLDGDAGSVLGKVTYTDSGSFVVSLQGKVAKVIEKVNKDLPDKLNYRGKCVVTQLKPGAGLINIGTAVYIKVTPSLLLGASPTIEIMFSRTPVILPLLQFVCPDQSGGTFTSTNAQANTMAAAMMPAFPQQIKFEAKEGEQTILQLGEKSDPIFVNFTVRQVKTDSESGMNRK
jgi:hypothetical protein